MESDNSLGNVYPQLAWQLCRLYSESLFACVDEQSQPRIVLCCFQYFDFPSFLTNEKEIVSLLHRFPIERSNYLLSLRLGLRHPSNRSASTTANFQVQYTQRSACREHKAYYLMLIHLEAYTCGGVLLQRRHWLWCTISTSP